MSKVAVNSTLRLAIDRMTRLRIEELERSASALDQPPSAETCASAALIRARAAARSGNRASEIAWYRAAVHFERRIAARSTRAAS
jgi:hypothetical protein